MKKIVCGILAGCLVLATATGCQKNASGKTPITLNEVAHSIFYAPQYAAIELGYFKEEGIDLYYHNHHVEFARYNGKYLLDIIKDNTKNLGFELDIHWIHRGGENPVEFIKKYAGRIRLLHLKDYRIGEMKMPEGGIDFTNRESIMKFMGGFNNVVQFAEVGEGTLPVAACIEAGLAGGSEYFLVEQDDTYGRDPFESLKISHDNLVKLGYGEWF